MKNLFKNGIFASVVGGILSLPIIQVILFAGTDWGVDYVQKHSIAFGIGGLISLVSAFIAGGLVGGWVDYKNFKWSETVQGETRFNPAWGWFILSFLIQFGACFMFE